MEDRSSADLDTTGWGSLGTTCGSRWCMNFWPLTVLCDYRDVLSVTIAGSATSRHWTCSEVTLEIGAKWCQIFTIGVAEAALFVRFELSISEEIESRVYSQAGDQ